MRKNQEMLVSELSWLRQIILKYAPTKICQSQQNGRTTRQSYTKGRHKRKEIVKEFR